MTVWVLVMYMLNPRPSYIIPGQDPHIAYEREFKTNAECLHEKQQMERSDAGRGVAGDFAYKCVRRAIGNAP